MPPDDASLALNDILSEVLDVVQEVKQADRKVPRSKALHRELDRLLEDVVAWARRLIEQDEALGVSPLASMPSVAGRTPPNLWPGPVDDEQVRALIDDHLHRLEDHVTAAMTAQTDSASRDVLGAVLAGVIDHRKSLGDLRA